MQNFLGTCLALGILAGGFALTGDLGRLAARGMRVIHATGVPDDDAPIPVSPRPGSAAEPAPLAPAVPGSLRPRVGPDRVAVADAGTGTRILVWLDDAAEPLAVDVVGPGAAAVILQRGTPRRVAITGGGIVRGEPLRVVPLGLAHAGSDSAAESLGTVRQITVGR